MMPVTALIPASIAAPWQQIRDLATADGWEFVYDYTNPNTLTLDGSSKVSDLTDGLGNRAKLRQTDTALRPAISVGRFGQLDGALYNDGPLLVTPAAEWTSFNGPATYIILVEHVVVNLSSRFWNLHNSTSGNDRISTRGTNPRFVLVGSLLIESALGVEHTTSPAIQTYIFNGASSKIIENDVEVASGDTGTHTNAGNTVGKRISSTTHCNAYLGAKLGRLDASTAEIMRMQDLLHDLTGIAKES